MSTAAAVEGAAPAKAGKKKLIIVLALVLLVLAHKRASDLLERSGKEKLADEVLRETERALGIDPPPPGAVAKKNADPEARPVRAVHFSNFIIQ